MYNVTLTISSHCSHNGSENSIGEYVATLYCKGKEKVVSGFESGTTSNSIVLRAAIESVKMLKKPCEITLQTNNVYVVNTANNMRIYMQNKFCNKSGNPIANLDLWKELIAASKNGNHHIVFEKI